MGLMHRTFFHLDMYDFNLLYKSLVRPHLEYSNIICSPFPKSDINLLENINKHQYSEYQ